MSSDVAIKVDKLSKCYHIYDKPRDRLKQFVLPFLWRAAGFPPKQYYREFWALKNVSFEVRQGETVGIIGRNGSGKSTLLQVICDTLNPTNGLVETTGRVAALLELGSGFNPEFSGRENVYLNASVLGLDKREIDERFGDIAAFADIGDFIEQPVKTYSSGMTVRLAFAVIAHVDADLLVIDEALAVGDTAFSRKCMAFLRRFMDRGTVLFVSHDTAAIRGLCNRAIWLQNGEVIGDGSPKEISEAYLQSLYAEKHVANVEKKFGIPDAPTRPKQRHDMRRDFINASTLRNDIEVMEMLAGASGFGKGGVQVTEVYLEDESGKPLSWIVGGEMVRLVVKGEVEETLESIIVGFSFKDRLGQYLFGDNTHLAHADNPVRIEAGRGFRAGFTFMMPVLRAGDYSIDIAVAEGVQADHVQRLWLHDVVALKSVASSVCSGLIGIPIEIITLEEVRI
jgi:lipopolysaccharide transport system ATP-binding protein